ncbi:hypothetical protein QUB63_33580 [Microcoleus sp. ARI1-B5]
MQNSNWKKLQNGSDIRGIALEGVPDEQVNRCNRKRYELQM